VENILELTLCFVLYHRTKYHISRSHVNSNFVYLLFLLRRIGQSELRRRIAFPARSRWDK